MVTKRDAGDAPSQFPHIGIRFAEGQPEPYLPGTGLSVWEIAWLARLYEGDVDAVARHLEACPISHSLIEEALRYTHTHPHEIDPVVEMVEGMTEERLREMLPGMTVITFDPLPPDEQPA